MSKLPTGHPVNYLFRREVHDSVPSAKHVIDRSMLTSQHFFRKNLYAHFGCVNALEFSNDGSYLVSGGDDRRILLWKVGPALKSKTEPTVLQAEHGSNVFALAIDSCNQKIYSAGNDDQVIVHDVTTGVPLDYFVHEQPVYGVSIDPLNDNIFASACDDGRLLVYDIRESSAEPFCLASVPSAFHAIMFHPSEPRLVVSGNSKEGVALWDIRKPKSTLLRYGGLSADQCCMSARFSSDGSKILALRRRLPPILYSTHDTAHLFQFNHTGYYNSCTMKSCSFAGPNDEFVLSGSDNFDLYMWRIPPPGSDRWVEKAHRILKGHRSIVNQVRYNKAHSVIISSGVEKLIKVWSPFSMLSGRKSPGMNSMFNMYEKERRIYSHTEYINLVTQSGQFMSLTFDTTRKTTKEDPRMMAFFDALVLRDLEGWSEDSDNIAENSYAVVSQESSSDDSSEEALSQSVFNTSTETSTNQEYGVETVASSNRQQQGSFQLLVGETESEETRNVSHNQPEYNPISEDGGSQQGIVPISSFEDGGPSTSRQSSAVHTNEESITENDNTNNNNDNNANQGTRQRLELDTSGDEDVDALKEFMESLPPTSNTKHHNIIKELISKKHERLHQLAKAHVVLESTIKKPGKKRIGRNYRNHTYSSSDKQEEKENDSDKKNKKKKVKRKENEGELSSSSSSSSSDNETCEHFEANDLCSSSPTSVLRHTSGRDGRKLKSDPSSSSSNSSGNSFRSTLRHLGHRRRRRKSFNVDSEPSKSRRSSSATTSPSSSRRLNKRKMFESFKSLRYERKMSSNENGGNGESGPFCSFYCQSQGRYNHKRSKNSDSSSSSSSNSKNNDSKKKKVKCYTDGNNIDEEADGSRPCTSAAARYKDSKNKPKMTEKSNLTNSTKSSSSSSSSSTSSSSSRSNSSHSDSSSKSSSHRQSLNKSKPKPCLSPNLVPKKYRNDSSSSDDDNTNDDSESEKIQQQIDSIKNSPAFKMSPLIRRIEQERLRKLQQQKQKCKENPQKSDSLEQENDEKCGSAFKNSDIMTKKNNKKRTWSNSKLSYQSRNGLSSSSSSSSTSVDNYKFLSKQPKRRFKYLNPNYKNYSSNDPELCVKGGSTDQKSDSNNTEVDSHVTSIVLPSSTSMIVTAFDPDENDLGNHIDTCTLNLNNVSQLDEEASNNNNDTMNNTTISTTTTTNPATTIEENSNENGEHTVPYDFSLI